MDESRRLDWILLIGLLYRVYAMTGSTVASAFTVLSAGVPQVLLSPVAGVLADRWNRKKTMVYADVLLAAGLVPLLFVHGRGDVWIVYLVLVWEGCKISTDPQFVDKVVDVVGLYQGWELNT